MAPHLLLALLSAVGQPAAEAQVVPYGADRKSVV
mgnify:CR=1 FL=1